MKNAVKYILQSILGYERYLRLFSKYKIKTLKGDKKEGDFFAFMQVIKPEGVILDVGANIGIMTVHLAQNFNKQKVYAIEPMPNNLLVLSQIIESYGLKNVEILPYAVGEVEQEVEMVLPFNGKVKMQGLAHVVHESIEEWNEGEHLKVSCKRLDDWFEDNAVAGIKMDIENFEYFALKGGEQMLKNSHPPVYLELWDNENRQLCFDWMTHLGYDCYVNQAGQLKVFDAKQDKHQNFIFMAKA